MSKQDAHLQTVVEVLQSIKASEMTPMLQRIYGSEGGSELLDVLMKYLWVATLLPSSCPLSFRIRTRGTNPVATCYTATRAWRRQASLARLPK